jgi:predicted N-acetyltransferase YhbS
MLRNAITSDIPNIRALMQMGARFWQPSRLEDTIAEAVRSANGLAFVWEHRSQVLGFGCAHDLGFRAYLSELIVDVRARRQGIGTRLVRAIEEVLRGRGRSVLIADVWHDSEPFYRSLGWLPADALLLRHRLQLRD